MVNTSTFVKRMLGFSIVPVFTALITLVVIPVVSYVFPAEQYGKINIFYSMGSLLVIGVMLGLDNSLIRYYYEPPKGFTSRDIIVVAFVIGSIVIISGSIVIYLVANDAASRFLFGETTTWGIPLLAAYTFGLMVLRLLNIDARMKGDTSAYNWQNIAQCIVTRMIFVFVALWSTYYLYSIIVMTVGILVVAGVCLRSQRDALSPLGYRPSHAGFRALIAFGFPVMLTNLVLNLNSSIGRLILGWYGLYDAAGVLAIATTLSSVFSIIPSAFNTYWSPFMYKHYRDERAFIMRVHDYVVFGSVAIVVGIVLFQDFLFSIVGGDYSSCQAYFMLIMLNPIQMLICETTAYGIFLEEHPVCNTLISASGVIVCGLITLTLAPYMGVMGAAIGIAASSLLIGIARSVVGQRYYRSLSNASKTAVGCISIIILCVINYFMYSNILVRFLICSFVILCVLVAYRKEAAYLFDVAVGWIVRFIKKK